MIFAVISDIHGHGEALSACLVLLSNLHIKKIFCLGDIIDGGPDDKECVAILRNNNIACVRGNHDEFKDLDLSNEDYQWLDQLPLSMEFQSWYMVHDTPRIGTRKIRDQYEAWNCFDETVHKRILTGHAHVPAIYEYDEQRGKSAEHVSVFDHEHTMRADCRYLVSVPSLAYNRAVCSRPGFCIIDERSVVFSYLDVEPIQ